MHFKSYISIFLMILFVSTMIGQNSMCDPNIMETQSQRLANYKMVVVLDHDKKTATGTQSIEWINNGNDSVYHVEMYMYLNGFKSPKSSYLANTALNVMGQDISDRPSETWGHIDINNVTQNNRAESLDNYYIQKLDDNPDDQSVLRIDLIDGVGPGDTLYLHTEFQSKLPKTIARVGYAANNFHFFVHWYPKLGVYEQNEDGIWGWNCHQFLQRMEFYGEFGTYELEITTDDMMVVGASGCRLLKVPNSDGTTTHHFEAHDVIDFAWCAYPDFVVYEDNFNGVEIELLSPAHHKKLVPRLMGAVKNSLDFLTTHVGPYPYPKITVMDPPALGMRSGFMEYPTFITGGSFYGFPTGVKSLESLIVHEFCHQYFMGMMATNEKEAPWLDEGFVTFFEDEVMETYYGKKNSLIDFMGYEVPNSAMSRNEYTSLDDKRSSHITNKSWLIQGDYKGIVYSKTSTVLRSVKRIIGKEAFYDFIRVYFSKYKFTHPRKADFINTINEFVEARLGENVKIEVSDLLRQSLDETAICDFSAGSIVALKDDAGRYQSTVTIQQLGDYIAPVEVVFIYSDGHQEILKWNGQGDSKTYSFNTESKLVSVNIDPERKYYFDIDFNNNSYTNAPVKTGVLKYAGRALFWTQNIFQSISFLM